MNQEEQIKVVADQVRKDLERFQKIDKRWTKHLRGACATAAFLIQAKLKKKSIEAWMMHASHKSYLHGDHMWVETNEFIIDVTYSQFDKTNKIVIINKASDEADDYQGNFYNILNAGDNMEFFDLIKWPAAQDPKKCLERMKNKLK